VIAQVLPSDDAARRRVLDHLGWTVHVLSGSVTWYGSAWGVRTPSLPQVWTLNQLHVSGASAVEDVLALSDTHQGAMPFRHVEISDEQAAAAFEAHARADGWTVDREVLMVLGPRTTPGEEAGIVSLDEEAAMYLMRRWLAEEFPAMTEAVRLQLEEYSLGEGRLWDEHVLGILDAAGGPSAMTKLRVSGDTAWLEDVFTVPEARRKGSARRLVARAAALAADAIHGSATGLVFIVADDNDWPKHLYAEIGFRPVGRLWTFHKELGSG
jgi:GNAT superfamily N-acetyltransferase